MSVNTNDTYKPVNKPGFINFLLAFTYVPRIKLCKGHAWAYTSTWAVLLLKTVLAILIVQYP